VLKRDALLILSGSAEALPGILVAKNMGLYVIVCDGDINAPGKDLANDFLHASIYHPDQIIFALKKYRKKESIGAVITIAADNPVSVAEVSNFLGLKALSLNTANLSTNKLLMKESLKDSGILMPWFKGIENVDDLTQTIKSRPSRYVLKPVDSRGSRGVVRINSHTECIDAFNYAITFSNIKKLILEEWIDGPQLSSESIVWNSKSYLCGLADRNYGRLEETYPYVVEDGGETPSILSSLKMEKAINHIIDKIAAKIGLESGSIKGDLILFNKKIYLIEFASRLSGGDFSTKTIPLVYGYNLIENIIKMSFHKIPDFPPSPLINKCFQANRFLFLPPGKLKKVENFNLNITNLIEVKVFVEPNQEILKIKNHTMRCGYAFVIDKSRELAIDKAKFAIENIKYEFN